MGILAQLLPSTPAKPSIQNCRDVASRRVVGDGMNSSEENPKQTANSSNSGGDGEAFIKRKKPPFRPAKDDTKPLLQDPILRSDPIETEEAVLMLPPFRPTK